jgi:hypothetical protein
MKEYDQALDTALSALDVAKKIGSVRTGNKIRCGDPS